MTKIACLSPFSEELVRELVAGEGGTANLEVQPAPDPPTREAIRELLADADLVISDGRHHHRLDRELLGAMRRCRLIQQPAVGFDVIDHRAAAEFGIPVANCAGYNRDSVADWVIMAILNLVRHGARGDRTMRDGGWPAATMEGRELGALTVGIVGLGNVGNAVATRLRAFGCHLLFHDVVPRSLPGAEPASLSDLLGRADVVTVHVPLDHDTRPLLSAAELDRMRPGAILVNASRGPVVDEAALVQCLEAGHLGGAALDVFEHEPLADDSPLRQLDNVFLTPHIGGNTADAKARSLEVVGTNLRRVIAGLEPFHVVNGVSLRT